MIAPLKRLVDTLMGRTALVLILMLALSHFAVFGLFVLFHRDDLHQQFATQLLATALAQRNEYLQMQAPQRQTILNQRLGALSLALPPDAKPTQSDHDRRANALLTAQLGAGTWLGHTLDGHGPPQLWLRFPLAGQWVWYSQRMPPPDGRHGGGPNSLLALVVMLTFIALIGTLALLWPLYRPLKRLADAQRAVGRGQAVAPLPQQGPLEVVQLTTSFNNMVTDLNALESERRLLLAGVSHDLRTPLARLRMRLALLDQVDVTPFERDVSDIERITEQFLAYVRGESDDGQREAVDLGLLMYELAERYGSPTVVVETAETGRTASVDRLAIYRALTNLIDNALTHGAAPVWLSATYENGMWTLSVRDSGNGLTDDALTAVRQPFHRMDAARQGRGHCGLGLTIVERIAKRHGGQLQLINAPNHGLIASLILPAGE